jgi:glycerol-3-phosphate O-acyltransferase
MCVSMFSEYSMRSIRLFGWLLHKLFSSMYERVVTDKTDIARIQAHDESKGPLVIVPTHRSYIDFLIISYVFFGHGIKCPHIAAA